jgi:hypothetical protein
MKENYHLIEYKFNTGIYSLEKMCEFVQNHNISEEDFHFITSYNYKAINNGCE